MEHIQAAGCIPFMRTRERELMALLVLNKGGYWEFPKGKCEAGETPDTAALRELKEETGLAGELTAEQPVDISYTFSRDGKTYEKTVHFFFCRVPDASVPRLQKSELNDYVWLPLEDLADRATYPQMKEVARKAALVLAD